MRRLKHLAACAAGIAMATVFVAETLGVTTAAAAPLNPLNTDRETRMPMNTIFRRCDFTDDAHSAPSGPGIANSVVKVNGNHVSADVTLATGTSDTPFRVRLIQVPRTTLSCAVGTPGVGFATLNTDGAGNGNITVSDTLLPGSTAVFVFLEGAPGEFYASDALVRV